MDILWARRQGAFVLYLPFVYSPRKACSKLVLPRLGWPYAGGGVVLLPVVVDAEEALKGGCSQYS